MAPDGKGTRWIEAAVAVTISLAGLASTWASYQAGLWDGEQAHHYGVAGTLRTRSTAAALDASVARAVDAGLFSGWVNARDTGNARLTGVYERRFPPVLHAAFVDWMRQEPFSDSSAPPSPFSLSSYRQPGVVEAKALARAADDEFEAGQEANRISDAFTRSAVILGMAMFFGGIGQVFGGRTVRVALVSVAILACGVGVYQLLQLPRAVID